MTLDLSRRLISARAPFGGNPRGPASQNALAGLKISHIIIPMSVALSDAKVLTGRQSRRLPRGALDRTFPLAGTLVRRRA